MSQVFSADAARVGGPVNVSGGTETPVVTGNFLSPPFNNAKAIIIGTILVTVPTGTTATAVFVRRNPSAENLQVGSVFNLNAAAGSIITVTVQTSDVIPDGRPVQYQLSAQFTGQSATANVTNPSIAAFLISG